MPKDGTAAVAAPKTRKRRSHATATGPATARASRHSYKKQAEALTAENERLKAKVARLEAQPQASHESSLILRTATDSFEAGVKTGLMLQSK